MGMMNSKRMENLLDLSKDQQRASFTYGLNIPSLDLQQRSFVGYVHNRWPRYRFDDDDLDVEVQWMVHNRLVLQQYVIKNKWPDEQRIPVHFASRMHIRDLEYLQDNNHFNENWEGQVCMKAPNGYGWIIANPLKHKLESSTKQQEQTDRRTSGEEFPPSYSKSLVSDGTPNGHTEDPERQDPDLGAIAVLVSVFVDGEALKWETSSSGNSQEEFELPAKDLAGGDVTEIVVAYKMIHLPKYEDHDQEWKTFLISQAAANVNQFLDDESATWKPFVFSKKDKNTLEIKDSSGVENPEGFPKDKPSPSKHINFILQRTLEHILSVCAIPINPKDPSEDSQIALTCGDISGHRISTSASFFAFSFLVKILELLNEGSCKDGDSFEFLRKRITKICQGHLRWLSKVDKTPMGCYAANYWVTGRIIDSNNSLSFTPSDSFTDSAFQIIKAAEFANLSYDETDRDIARGIIHDRAKSWIMSLDKSDIRGSRAWSHTKVEGYNKYRLNVHFWIWRALKLFEECSHAASEPKSTKRENKPPPEEPFTPKSVGMQHKLGRNGGKIQEEKELYRRFAAGDVQRDILRRFTAENDVSKKRMLAMTRSPRETRYLFHAADTALFHGLNDDFFLPETSFNEVWENTLEAQVHHSENSETGWDNLTRYALAVMIGSRGRSINKRSPKDLIISSLNIIFGASSQHGLFHGQIDGTTKEPAVFTMEEDKDFFFHATFEIPFILLTHSTRIYSKLKDEQSDQDGSTGPDQSTEAREAHNLVKEAAERITKQPKWQQSPVMDRDSKMLDISAENLISSQDYSMGVKRIVQSKPPQTISMKKSMPFNSLIDQTSIVEIKEEWLYNYPVFLLMDKELDDVYLKDEVFRLEQVEGDAPRAVIAAAAKDFWDITKGNPTKDSFDQKRAISWIVDVPKKSQVSKRERKGQGFEPKVCYGSHDLWSELKAVRTAKVAKKRVIWLPCASKETALVCSLASQGDETSAIPSFFDLHSHCKNFFFDDSTMYLNEWQTELHLSFYQLVNEKLQPPIQGIPAQIEGPTLPNGDMKLVQASIGFRFVGDFFDRYWTFHLVEHIPSKMAKLLLVDEKFDETKVLEVFTPPWGRYKTDVVQDQDFWRQRKVLELSAFDRMLKELVESTKDIYTTVRTNLGISNSASMFSALNSGDYFKSSAQWQRYQQILQIVEEELDDVFLTISKWNARQKDRGLERPRWTRDDERKYRQNIRKLEGQNRHRIRDLQKYYNTIRSLKETLKNSQGQIGNDLNLRGSENIRFFTYVTVVFLPLGFAASVFSLSDEPPSGVVIPMIICAVIALLLTALALVNAKKLNASLGKISDAVDRYSTGKMQESLLFSSKGNTGNDTTTENYDKPPDAEKARESKPHRRDTMPSDMPRDVHRDDTSWHLSFWLAYVFVEIPARRIAAALQVVKNPTVPNWYTCVNLIFGVFLLPIFIFSLISQIALWNLFDCLQRCWGYLKEIKLDNEEEDNDPLQRYKKWLAYPLERFRPFKDKEGVKEKEKEKGDNGDEMGRVDSSHSKSESE